MTYLQTRKHGASRHVRVLVTLGACALVVIAFIHLFRPSFFPSLAATIARPFWRAELGLELGSMRTPQSLLQENEELQRKLAEAEVRLSTIGAIEAENSELKSLMNRATTTQYTVAAVLAHPPLTLYDELIIDAGEDRGFTIGNNVYADGDVLIGRVSQVFGQTSKVRLLSSPGETYPVMVGTDHIPATAVGRGGGQYEVQLPRDMHIVQGDFVVAPSLSGRPFGVVSAVITDSAQPFLKVLFAPPVNVFQIRWVLVDPKIRLI